MEGGPRNFSPTPKAISLGLHSHRQTQEQHTGSSSSPQCFYFPVLKPRAWTTTLSWMNLSLWVNKISLTAFFWSISHTVCVWVGGVGVCVCENQSAVKLNLHLRMSKQTIKLINQSAEQPASVSCLIPQNKPQYVTSAQVRTETLARAF